MKQVCSFLGLIGYYHCFLPSYTSVVAPLTNLTRKHEPEIASRSEDCSKVFCKLKEISLPYPVLRNANFSPPFSNRWICLMLEWEQF